MKIKKSYKTFCLEALYMIGFFFILGLGVIFTTALYMIMPLLGVFPMILTTLILSMYIGLMPFSLLGRL